MSARGLNIILMIAVVVILILVVGIIVYASKKHSAYKNDRDNTSNRKPDNNREQSS
jgi:flagellar basal body-associated protein FliL